MDSATGDDAYARIAADAEALVRLRFDISEITGVELSPDVTAIFEALRERCPSRSIGRLYGAVRDGVAASYYHLRNIEELERDLLRHIRTMLRDHTGGVGAGTTFPGIAKIAAEYHAFHFAMRRTLEYMAKGVGDFMGVSGVRSIFTLEKAIDPRTIEERTVTACWSAGLVALQDLVQPAEGDKETTRNRIAHHEPIDGGQVCVTRRSMNLASPDYDLIEVRLIGGGERLFPWTDHGIELDPDDGKIILIQTLFPQLRDRLERIVSVTRGLYEVLAKCPSR